MTDDVCDHCRWRVTTAHYVDRDGRAARLCGRCLDRAVEFRDAMVRLDGMRDRLRAQQSQHRRLEEEHEQLQRRYARALREVAELRRINALDDTAEYPAAATPGTEAAR